MASNHKSALLSIASRLDVRLASLWPLPVSYFRRRPGPVAVHAQHMVRDLAVHVRVHVVHHDEEEVEAREEGVGERNVARGRQRVVVLQEEEEEHHRAA